LEAATPQSGEPLRLSIPVRRVSRIVAVVIATLCLVSFVGQVVSEFVITENEYIDKIAEWVDVNAEASIPTWYATITLMACSVMAAVIAVTARVRGRPYPLQWALVSVGFALLSLEEILGVHSQATKVLRSVVSITEGFGYVLVLGAIGLVGLAILAVVFGRFFMDLPSRWRRWFTIGAVIYLIGVFASDLVGDYLFTATEGETSLLYESVLTVEEALEMTGVLIFIVLLLEYIRVFVGPLAIEVRDPGGPSPAQG
jgi:hypothetical protein